MERQCSACSSETTWLSRAQGLPDGSHSASECHCVLCIVYIDAFVERFSEYNAGDMCQKVTSLTEQSSSSMLKLKLQDSNGVTGACITHHENKVSHTSPAC